MSPGSWKDLSHWSPLGHSKLPHLRAGAAERARPVEAPRARAPPPPLASSARRGPGQAPGGRDEREGGPPWPAAGRSAEGPGWGPRWGRDGGQGCADKPRRYPARPGAGAGGRAAEGGGPFQLQGSVIQAFPTPNPPGPPRRQTATAADKLGAVDKVLPAPAWNGPERTLPRGRPGRGTLHPPWQLLGLPQRVSRGWRSEKDATAGRCRCGQRFLPG